MFGSLVASYALRCHSYLSTIILHPKLALENVLRFIAQPPSDFSREHTASEYSFSPHGERFYHEIDPSLVLDKDRTRLDLAPTLDWRGRIG